MKQVTSARGQNTRMGGSDPTLCGFQPPKTFVGSLPPAPSCSGPCFVRVQRSEQTVCNAGRTTPRKRKGGKQLPLLKAPSKQPKTTTLQVRSGGRSQTQPGQIRRVHRRKCVLRRQRSTQAAVQAGRRVQALAERTSDQHQPSNQPKETFLQRPRNRHEASFNPIRYAREYSVLKTACPALCNALDPESIREAVRHRTGGGDGLLPASFSQTSSLSSPNNAAHIAATEGEEGHGKHLLTVHEVADLLQVPVSWVYGRTRKRSLERIPSYRLGKYWRFRQDEVLAWVESQRRGSHAA